MALTTRAAVLQPAAPASDTTRLYPTSRLVASITGAADAAQQGDRRRERVRARIGHPPARHAQERADLRDHAARGRRPARARNLVLGKHSGRHALRERVRRARLRARRRSSSNRVFEEFKALADRKKELFDGDIEALVLRAEGHARTARGRWPASRSQRVTGAAPSTAIVKLQHADGRAPTCRASGDGPVDAAYKAIEHATGLAVKVRKFEVHARHRGRGRAGRDRRLRRRTTAAATAARASAPTSSRPACKALLEVINRIELAHRSARCAARAHRASSRATALRSPHAHPGHDRLHLVQRQAGALGEGDGACAVARPALRLVGVRGRTRLRDAQGRGDLPPARPHAAPVRLGEDLPHHHPVHAGSRSTPPAARWSRPTG